MQLFTGPSAKLTAHTSQHPCSSLLVLLHLGVARAVQRFMLPFVIFSGTALKTVLQEASLQSHVTYFVSYLPKEKSIALAEQTLFYAPIDNRHYPTI